MYVHHSFVVTMSKVLLKAMDIGCESDLREICSQVQNSTENISLFSVKNQI